MRTDDEGNVVTQVPDHDVEALGLLKMDFLGLRNLDVIQGALELIEDRSGAALDIETIPLDDPGTYAMLARGDAIGVFQFESSGMREALREVRPTEFADLIALVALYRPGPMAFIPTYARNKRDPSRVTFEDPRLETITGPTYGVAVYQEQLMAISRQLAGFSPSRADDLRKAVGKKDKVLMASLKDEFVARLHRERHRHEGGAEPLGPLRGGRRLLVQQEPRRLLRPAGVPHRLPQGEPPGRVHGLAAQLGDGHQGPRAVLRRRLHRHGPLGAAARRQRQPLRLRGDRRDGDPLRPVGREGRGRERRRRDHHRARRRRPASTTLWDFCRRVDQAQVNKRALESLIRGGALDSTGDTRLGMLDTIAAAVGQATRRRSDLAAGQESLFGAMGSPDAAVELDPPIPSREMPKDELLAAEKEALGLYVSSHPLQDCRQQLARAATCGIASLGRPRRRRAGDRRRACSARSRASPPARASR